MAIPGGAPCLVVDDFLLNPDRLVADAVEQREAFAEEGGNYFPGPEMNMPPAFNAMLAEFFMLHIRRALGARRTLEVSSRMSMVTKDPARLHPLQRLCHVDTFVGTRRVDPAAGEGVAAAVLYLFKDERLGGTSFYRPKKPLPEVRALIAQAGGMPAPIFTTLVGAEPGYMTASNDYFEQVLTIPARYNRAIFYDGAIFHSGQMAAPELLSADPAAGRLTLNGFFLVRRAAG